MEIRAGRADKRHGRRVEPEIAATMNRYVDTQGNGVNREHGFQLMEAWMETLPRVVCVPVC